MVYFKVTVLIDIVLRVIFKYLVTLYTHTFRTGHVYCYTK